MARRSRAVVETVKAKFRVWRIAIYIRLSKEDARCLDESESVTNQRQIIEDHIAGFNDGDEYIIVDEYVDDGISGTTDDERDDFQRMLADIKRGRVNCVIVKDPGGHPAGTGEQTGGSGSQMSAHAYLLHCGGHSFHLLCL